MSNNVTVVSVDPATADQYNTEKLKWVFDHSDIMSENRTTTAYMSSSIITFPADY